MTHSTERLIEKNIHILDTKIKEIDNETINIQTDIDNYSDIDDGSETTFKQIKDIFSKARLAKKYFLETDNQGRNDLLEEVLSNASIKDQKVANSKFKAPYSYIQKPLFQVIFMLCLHTWTASELF